MDQFEIDLSFKESFSNKNDQYSFNHILGVMIEFQHEFPLDDPTTSGNGLFLENLDIDFLAYDNISRCNKAILDPPPHNKNYFNNQIEAISNYFKNISNNSIDLNYDVIDSVYTASNYMREYSYSENHLTALYLEALELASSEIEVYLINNNVNIDEVLIVVFHSGLGQDIKAGIFDPTIYDIHSAYIDNEMLNSLDNSNLSNVCMDSNCWAYDNDITQGILMPETLNMIFYDVIEDVLPVTFINENELENIYCDSQYGITGLFAYLLGYAMGFPPMHDTNSGYTRIGKFGLMDQGSFNGRGVIPSIPNPWTRIKFLDYPFNNVTDSLFYHNQLTISIPKRSMNDTIYRIDISENEYFLIENSNNKIEFNNEVLELDEFSNYLEDSLEDEFYWVDALSFLEEDFFISDGVLTNVQNYDYGMPGSGILIWHIVEPDNGDYNIGINNDIENKVVHLEEGDGIINLGLLNPYPGLLSDEVITGYSDDYWYKNNQTYIDVNNLTQNSIVKFSNNSIPNSRTSSNIDSYITVKINSEIKDTMSVTIDLNTLFDIELISNDFKSYLGNNGIDCIYYLNSENNIFSKCGNVFTQLVSNDFENEFDISLVDENSQILYDSNNNLYLLSSHDFYIDIFNNNEVKSYIENPINPIGYYLDLNDDIMDEVIISNLHGYALGDIDIDGLDELVFVSDGKINIYNSNNTLVNGFPIFDDFYGNPLIIDIINDIYGTPEIICKNGNKLSIVSGFNGEIIYNIPLYDSHDNLSFMNNVSSNKSAIVNGDKLIIFDAIDESGIYWANSKSTTYNYPMVSGQSYNQRLNLLNIVDDLNNIGIDVNKAYNYPNPCTEYTVFRFFVGNSNDIQIKIYDINGKLIDEISNDGNLIKNEFNEMVWNVQGLEPGLYLAEIKSDLNEFKLLKIIIN